MTSDTFLRFKIYLCYAIQISEFKIVVAPVFSLCYSFQIILKCLNGWNPWNFNVECRHYECISNLPQCTMNSLVSIVNTVKWHCAPLRDAIFGIRIAPFKVLRSTHCSLCDKAQLKIIKKVESVIFIDNLVCKFSPQQIKGFHLIVVVPFAQFNFNLFRKNSQAREILRSPPGFAPNYTLFGVHPHFTLCGVAPRPTPHHHHYLSSYFTNISHFTYSKRFYW